MKRFWIGLFLLAALLGLGIFTTGAMDSAHTELARQLEQAGKAAGEENWPLAEDLLRRANATWEQRRGAIATLSSHGPMEEIDSLFSQLALYLKERERLGFLVCCDSLRSRVLALGQTHAVNWHSLL